MLCQMTMSSLRRTCFGFFPSSCISKSALFCNKDKVQSSLSLSSPPKNKGDLKRLHKLIIVRCSSFVKRVIRSEAPPSVERIPICPNGSISQSGQVPSSTKGAHFSQHSNISYS